MSERGSVSLREQLSGLETTIPQYDYEGLSLPEGLEVDAVFGTHRDVALMGDVKGLLSSYDVVVQENFGSNEATTRLLQKIANGDYKARERMLATIALNANGGPAAEEDQVLSIKALYNIRRPLVTIDPPADHPITRKTARRFTKEITHRRDFDQAVNDQKEELIVASQVNLDRENYMLKSFCQQITDIVHTNPRLAKAKETGQPVRVILFNFGLAHAGLFEGLKEVARRSGSELRGNARIIMDDGLALHHSAQSFGRRVYGLGIDDDLAAKAVVESTLVGDRMRKNPGLSQMVTTSEVIAEIDSKTTDQLRGIFEAITQRVS